jgi:hypothetical protein
MRPSQGLYILAQRSLLTFWCHPTGRADKGLGLFLLLTRPYKPTTDAKVRHLDISVGIQEEITSLDVAVNLSVFVNVGQAEESLPEHVNNVRFQGRNGQSLVVQYVPDGLQTMQSTALAHQRRDEPEVNVVAKGRQAGEHVGVTAEAHRLDFPTNFGQVRVHVIQIENLDGDFCLRLRGRAWHWLLRRETAEVDGGKGALANLTDQVVARGLRRPRKVGRDGSIGGVSRRCFCHCGESKSLAAAKRAGDARGYSSN